MNLTFDKSSRVMKKPNMNLTFKTKTKKLRNIDKVIKLRGVGVKTVAALAILNIYTIKDFKTKYNENGVEWMKRILPAGVKWRDVQTSLDRV